MAEAGAAVPEALMGSTETREVLKACAQGMKAVTQALTVLGVAMGRLGTGAPRAQSVVSLEEDELKESDVVVTAVFSSCPFPGTDGAQVDTQDAVNQRRRIPATPQRVSRMDSALAVIGALGRESEVGMQSKSVDVSFAALRFARFRLPSGRVLAAARSWEWEIAFREISEWAGPRGAFHLTKSDGTLLRVTSLLRVNTLENGEYGVIIQPDAGHGFELVILDEDGNRASRPAQLMQTGGFQHNAPAYLREYLALRDAPERTRWGTAWAAWLLMPYQCEHCKLVTTVLGANLLEWPIDFDCCRACSGRDFFNCARCERIVDESEPDVNMRPQDDALIWCAECSVRHSGNFTGC